MPPLTDFQKAFLRNILVAKTNIVDPETGEPLDWDSLVGGEHPDLAAHETLGLAPASDLTGLLDEAAHDALDHAGLPGIGAATMSMLLREALGDTTYVVDTATYPAAGAAREFRLDFESVLWDEFQIWTGWAQSNAASQSVFMRLDHNVGTLFALSGNADDLTIPNTRGHYATGWLPITRDMSAAGLATLHLSVRGSNSTVDLIHQGIGVSFRRSAA